MNRKSLESLIKAGALDSLGNDRGQLLGNIDILLEYNQSAKGAHSAQISIFGLMEDKTSVPELKLKVTPAINDKEKLSWEKDLLGLYISGHPLDAFRDKFQKEANTLAHFRTLADGSAIVGGGIITEVRAINTKKGDRMAFIKLADFSGNLEAVAFPRTFEQFKDLLVVDQCLAVKGKISVRNGEPSIALEAVKPLTN
jgi:DNA polymerase-3 subunit alpha